jgi:hypothetical protein
MYNNSIKITAASLLIAVSLTLPFISFAQTATTTTGSGANFCSRLPVVSANLQKSITDRIANLTQYQTNVTTNIQTRRAKTDSDLKADRTTAEARLQDQFAKLTQKATTSSEQQAVQTFEATINSAVTAHVQAIDTAGQTFRTAEDGVISTHQSAVMSAVTSFQSSVNAAITQANSNCSSGMAPATARQTFTGSVSSARSALKSSEQQIAKAAPQIQSLIQTRQQSVQLANATFKSAVSQAVQTLKLAFPNPTTSSTTTTPAQ